jgi:hypothetical protein
MIKLPTLVKADKSGFTPAFAHVGTGADRHADIFSSIAIISGVQLADVFKSAQNLGLRKDGPYYHYLTEELLAGIGASFGLVFTIWKECNGLAGLPDLCIALIRYDSDYEVGAACVIHKAKSSHDGRMITYVIDPAAIEPQHQVSTDLDQLKPAWYIGVHAMTSPTATK